MAWQRRWYLVARDPRDDAWQPYRVDWLELKTPGGRRFLPQDFPGDLTEFVVREVARTGGPCTRASASTRAPTR